MKALDNLKRKMATITSEFDTKLSQILIENKHWLVMLQADQLNAGLSQTGNQLSPSYLQDPFFDSQAYAVAYMNMKERIYAPQYFKIYPEKPNDIPNLIVTGALFHNFLDVDINGTKVRLNADGSPIYSSITTKYGDIMGLTPYSLEFFKKTYIEPALMEWTKQVLQ